LQTIIEKPASSKSPTPSLNTTDALPTPLDAALRIAHATAAGSLSGRKTRSDPTSFAATIPTIPYPHPRSRILSVGPNVEHDSSAVVPASMALGENRPGSVSRATSTLWMDA
jgi:hypothetical protein